MAVTSLIYKITKLTEEAEILQKNRFRKIGISDETFRRLLTLYANYLLIQRGETQTKFVIDEKNEHAVKFLHGYVTGENNSIDHNKGILISGQFGTGKTILLTSFALLYEAMTIETGKGINIIKFRARDFAELKKANEPGCFDKRLILIDELGRDEIIVKEYGNQLTPLSDLLCSRYDYGSITFATSNLSLSDLETNYSGTLGDRFKSMFNYIELTGKSRRK